MDNNVSKSQIFSKILEFIKFMIYPLIELYGYFVFIGLFCLQGKNINIYLLLTFFLVYHLLLMNKIIFFIELYVIKNVSTIDLFPSTKKLKQHDQFVNINPFVKQNVIERGIKESQFCNICNTFKPPRCHHCSKCNQCILKFDHHCNILNICIGFHNYNFFIKFLLNNVLLNAFVITVIMLDIFLVEELKAKILTCYVVAIFCFGIEFIIACVLLIFHAMLLSRNETTIEYYALNAYIKGDHSYVHIFQEGPIKNFIDSKNRKILNPYNLGFKENFQAIFGNTLWKVLSPIFNSDEDGVHFKTNDFDVDNNEI